MAGINLPPMDENDSLFHHQQMTEGADTRHGPNRDNDLLFHDWPSPEESLEPDALQDTLRRLESALNSVPGTEREWAAQVVTQLRDLRQRLGRHYGDAEAEDVFLTDLDFTPVLARRGERLSQEHSELLIQARMLLVLVSHELQDDPADFSMIHRRIELLLQGLRHQEMMEKDLIFGGLLMEVGAGD